MKQQQLSTGTIEEIWRDVLGYEGFYKISNLGRLMSLNRTDKKGSNIIMKPYQSRGYFQVNLKVKGIRKMKHIHRLIAIAFIPNPENKPHINHIDGNKGNNSMSNLEWCTPQENVRHAYDILNVINKRRKLSKEDVFYILSLGNFSDKKSLELSKIFNVSKSCISSIRRRTYYKNIQKEYEEQSKVRKHIVLFEAKK